MMTCENNIKILHPTDTCMCAWMMSGRMKIGAEIRLAHLIMYRWIVRSTYVVLFHWDKEVIHSGACSCDILLKK